MKLIRSARVAALFVGSVVGAGFATGQEISLFFGEDGVWSLVVASLFIALCAFAFLNIGAKGMPRDPRFLLATDSVVALSSFAVYAAMIAASEEVLKRLTGQAGLSVLLAVAVGVLAGKRVAWVSALNLVAVPLMAAVILWVGSRAAPVAENAFHPLRALAYGGMNLLFSGALMVEEGRETTFRERLAASAIVGGVLFAMLLSIRKAIGGASGVEMPFLAAATREGVGTFASLALLLAILTTMAGCAYLLIRRLSVLTHDRTLALSLTTLGGILTSIFGFAPLVAYTYPVVSWLGLLATLAAIGGGILRRFHPFKRAKKE